MDMVKAITLKRAYWGADKDYIAEFVPDAVSSAGSFHKPLLGFLRKHDFVRLPDGCYFVSGKESVAWNTKSSDYEDALKVAAEIQKAVSAAMDRYYELDAWDKVKRDMERWTEERKAGAIR